MNTATDEILAMRLIAGELSPDEFRAAQVRLGEDSDFRQIYGEHCLLANGLEEWFPQTWVHPSDLKGRTRTAGLHRRSGWIAAGAAISACIAASVIFLIGSREIPQDRVPTETARIDYSPTAVAYIEKGLLPDTGHPRTGLSTTIGSGGIVNLQRGMMELTLPDGGTTLTLEAPARIRMKSARHFFVDQGKMRISVKEGSEGILCEVGSWQIRDLGTDFGIQVGFAELGEVAVFDGRVSVWDTEGNKGFELQEGEGLRNSPEGMEKIRNADFSAYPGELPTEETILKWVGTDENSLKSFSEISGGIIGKSDTSVVFKHPGKGMRATMELPIELPTRGGSIVIVNLKAAIPSSNSGTAGITLMDGTHDRLFIGKNHLVGDSWICGLFTDSSQDMSDLVSLGIRDESIELRVSYDTHSGWMEVQQAVRDEWIPVFSRPFGKGEYFKRVGLLIDGSALSLEKLEVSCKK